MASNGNCFGAPNYYKLWLESMASTLGQFSGLQISAEMGGPVENLQDDRLWATFTIGEALLGEHAFSVSRADGLHLGQLFMAENLDPNAAFTADHADAFAELFRQFSGTVAMELKAALGTECTIRFKDSKAPAWNSVDNVSVVLLTEPRVTVASLIDTGLLNSLNTVPAAQIESEPEVAAPVSQEPVAAAPEETSVPTVPVPQAARAVEAPQEADSGVPTKINEKNLDLLLDLELEVSVRFGGRQMLLKEVLELSSGAMVELDRRVRDPIELILGGNVIARGEAVIVDGNYGIRITEVIPRRQRLAQIA